jgi:hypothetical protein
MPKFGTSYKEGSATFGGSNVLAEDFDHALLRMEFAIAMGWIPENSMLDGELVEVMDCPDELADAMNPIGRI